MHSFACTTQCVQLQSQQARSVPAACRTPRPRASSRKFDLPLLPKFRKSPFRQRCASTCCSSVSACTRFGVLITFTRVCVCVAGAPNGSDLQTSQACDSFLAASLPLRVVHNARAFALVPKRRDSESLARARSHAVCTSNPLCATVRMMHERALRRHLGRASSVGNSNVHFCRSLRCALISDHPCAAFIFSVRASAPPAAFYAGTQCNGRSIHRTATA